MIRDIRLLTCVGRGCRIADRNFALSVIDAVVKLRELDRHHGWSSGSFILQTSELSILIAVCDTYHSSLDFCKRGSCHVKRRLTPHRSLTFEPHTGQPFREMLKHRDVIDCIRHVRHEELQLDSRHTYLDTPRHFRTSIENEALLPRSRHRDLFVARLRYHMSQII